MKRTVVDGKCTRAFLYARVCFWTSAILGDGLCKYGHVCGTGRYIGDEAQRTMMNRLRRRCDCS